MKYVIVIPDGAADLPQESLDERTPLEAARTPALDALAITGRQGTVSTTPKGMPCGSDVCTMSLLGYDPARYHTGRAPLEAAALGLEQGPRDWVFRANLVTVIDGRMADHSAGQITDPEARALLTALSRRLDLGTMQLHPGVGYRHILLDPDVDAHHPDWAELVTTAPHDVPGEPIDRRRPVGGPDAGKLNALIDASAVILAEHEVNATRVELGESPATHLWPWGQGLRPAMPSFAELHGLRGAMITAVDLLAGLAKLIGWDRLDVPGQTSYHDTDYAAAGRHAIAALDGYDLVCVHVEAPDEAAHAGDADTKVAAIEAIDEHVVAPLVAHLQSLESEHRILCLPDHYTRCDNRKHDPTPPPFLINGDRVRSVLKRPFSERNANDSDLHITSGHELMEYFLKAGL